MRSALTKKDRQGLRELLFPAIGSGVITGFNIYKERPVVRNDFLLSYMHSDLDEEDRHRQQLFEALEGYSPTVVSTERYDVVSRETDYRIEDKRWLLKGLKLFDARARPISDLLARGKIKKRETVVGEATQKELRLQLPLEDLFKVTEIFHDKVFFFKASPVSGKLYKVKGHKIRNVNAIEEAWDVPMICIEPRSEDLQEEIPTPYNRIDKHIVCGYQEEVSSLVDKKSSVFQRYLSEKECKTVIKDVFAHKTFMDYINKPKRPKSI